MKISENSLRAFVNPPVSVQQLAERITLAGLEVAAILPVAGEFTGVVVGQVVSREQHPDADKLSVCRVDIGLLELQQIVCGASNVRAGLKVAVATLNAILPGNFKIKKAKLRGVESFGMLCSASELGLAESSEGILELPAEAPIGQDFRNYFQLNDHMIEIELTPNRGDAASVLGVARDVAALYDLPIEKKHSAKIQSQHQRALKISTQSTEACPVYFGCLIDHIDNGKTSPLWLQEALRRSGLRSINPVVDVSNFVMLELGQPTHAFDAALLSEDIVVRFAESSETLTLLNGEEVQLQKNNLLITSGDKPVALAGVMGGRETEVSAKTTAIFIESAYFDPLVIRRSARVHHLNSDASYRFERGVDWQLPAQALNRVVELLLSIVGGEPGPVTHYEYLDSIAKAVVIDLSFEKLNAILGTDLKVAQIVSLLERLGFDVQSEEKQCRVTVPSYRNDVRIDVDLIEEVGRIYGYANIPAAENQFSMHFDREDTEKPLQQCRQQLLALGYSEAINYSFTDPLYTAIFNTVEPFVLANPMSAEQSVMRTSVVASLLMNASYNLARQQNHLALFELGKIYLPVASGVVEKNRLAMLLTGDICPKQWSVASRSADFYDLKGDIDSVLAYFGVRGHWQLAEKSFLHPGQTAEYFVAGESLGFIGKLHPEVKKALGLKQDCYVLEMATEVFFRSERSRFQAISKFPSVKRDLAFLVDEAVQMAEIEHYISEGCEGNLKEFVVFDIYRGEGVPAGQKSVAIGLILQNSTQTLDESEITAIIQRVIANLARGFNITLRA